MKKILITLFLLCSIYLMQNDFFIKKENKEEIKKVSITKDNDVESLDIEEYVIGVLACEMPASFHIEALKANAVAARTYASYKLEKDESYILKTDTSDQCYYSEEQMKEKWGDEYEKYYGKIKGAVYETKGQILTYEGEVIKAFYFSTSNGKTETSALVFNEDLEYLKSVDSPWDAGTRNYLSEVTYTESELLNLLGLTDSKIEDIKILDISDSGRVNTIKVNSNTYKGTEIRTKLNLKSTDIEIEKRGNNYTFKVKGYGHGVGMSQYGANGMAKEGYNYKEILDHYYTNVVINNV